MAFFIQFSNVLFSYYEVAHQNTPSLCSGSLCQILKSPRNCSCTLKSFLIHQRLFFVCLSASVNSLCKLLFNFPFKTFCWSLDFKRGHSVRTNWQTDGAIVVERRVEGGGGEREWEVPVLLVMTQNEILIAEQQGHRVTCCDDHSDRQPAVSPHNQSGRQTSCLNVYI